MAEVGQVVDRGAADVHRHPARPVRLEGLQTARRSVVEPQHLGTVTRSWTLLGRRPRPSTHPAGHPRAPFARGPRGEMVGPLGGRRDLPLRPPGVPGPDLRHRHPAADRLGLAPRRSRLLLHPHRRRGPVSSGCGAGTSSTRWAGTTTGCRPSAGCRTSTGCAATRSLPYDPDFAPTRQTGTQEATPCRSRGRTSWPCASGSPRRTNGPSRRPGAGSGSRSTGRSPTPPSTSGPAGPPSGASCACLAARRGLPERGAHAVGRRLPDGGLPGRARRPRAARRLPPAALCRWTRGRRSRSRRPGPSSCPPASPSSPTPTTPATGSSSAPRSAPRSSVSRCPWWPTTWPSRQGRRGSPWSARSATPPTCMWWRELDLATRTIVGRDGRLRARDLGGAGVGLRRSGAGGRHLRRAGRADGAPGPVAHRRAARASRATSWASRARSPTRSSSTSAASGRSRSSRRASGSSAPWTLRDRLLRRGEELAWHPPYMAQRYRVVGRGSEQPTGTSRASATSASRSRCGTRSTTTGRVEFDRPLVARRDRPAGRPLDRRAPGLHARPAGRARRVRRRPRRDGHLGHLVAHPRDRRALGGRPRSVRPGLPDGPAAPGARDHPDLALLHDRAQRARARLAALVGNAAISGWVLDPDRKKMSKSKGNVVTPLPLLEHHGSDAVRYWAASGRPGSDTAVDEGQMKVGGGWPSRCSTPRASPSAGSATRCGAAGGGGPSRSTGPCSTGLRRWSSTRPRRPSRATTTPGPSSATETFFWTFCDDYLELVKSRAYGAPGPAEGLGAAGNGAHRPAGATASARSALAIALGAAPPVRPVPALRHRGGLVVVAGGLGAPRPVARDRRARRGRPGSRLAPTCSASRPRCSASCDGPRRRPSARCAPGSPAAR